MLTRAGLLYLASFVAHGALAVGIVSLKGERKYEDVSIALVETKKKEKPKADEPPPPPPTPKAEATAAPKVAKAAPVPAAKAEAISEAPAGDSVGAIPDFGLSLGGGPGLAVRTAPAAAAPVASAAPPPVHKVLTAAAPVDKCDEAPVKPKPIAMGQPAYTSEARAANVAGKVRVEITVDESGRVTKVRLLEGLGYGLDDAALATARAATFQPGTRCGKPAQATFTVAMRFTL